MPIVHDSRICSSRIWIRLTPLAAALGFAACAFGGSVSFPMSNLRCGVYQAPFYWSGGPTTIEDGADCTGYASASPITSNPEIQGVSFGMSAPVPWTVKGTAAGGTEAYPDAAGEFQGNSLVMSTQGLAGGAPGYISPGADIPLHYAFDIAAPTTYCPGGPGVNCWVASSVDWGLTMLIVGDAVGGGELVGFSASGSGLGPFSGDGYQHVNQIAAGQSMSVLAILNLTAHFGSGTIATFGVTVPAGASYDFESDQSVPEPATLGLLAAGLAALGAARARRIRPDR